MLRGRTSWWLPQAANDAIDWHQDREIAIIGVDLVYIRGENTFAATYYSDASGSQHSTAWHEYVERCAAGARNFVTKHAHESDAHFDVTVATKAMLE